MIIDSVYNKFEGVTVGTQEESERLIPPMLGKYNGFGCFVHVVGAVELDTIECYEEEKMHYLNAFTGVSTCAETGDGESWAGGQYLKRVEFILIGGNVSELDAEYLKELALSYGIPVFELVKA